MPSLVEMGQVVLEKKILKSFLIYYIFTIYRMYSPISMLRLWVESTFWDEFWDIFCITPTSRYQCLPNQIVDFFPLLPLCHVFVVNIRRTLISLRNVHKKDKMYWVRIIMIKKLNKQTRHLLFITFIIHVYQYNAKTVTIGRVCEVRISLVTY